MGACIVNGAGVDYGLPVCLGSSEAGVCSGELAAGECCGSIGDHRPVRAQQGTTAGTEEHLCQSDRTFAPGVPSAAAVLHAERITRSA